MAGRTYYFANEPFNLARTLQLVDPAAALASVVSPSHLSFLRVTADDAVSADTIETLADLGYAYVADQLTAGAPVYDQTRHYGTYTPTGPVPAPVFPAVAESYRYWNNTYNVENYHDGVLWNPISPMFRPVLDDGTFPAVLFVDNVAGSDAFDGLTAPTAFATLRRAVQFCASNPTVVRTINIAASVVNYGWPAITTSMFSFITFQGPALTIVEPANAITSIGASSYATGISITVAGAPWAVDMHRGRIIHFLTGPLAGHFGVIYSNTASTLQCTEDTRAAVYLLPVIGNTFEILEQAATIDFPQSTTPILESSVQLNFRELKFAGATRTLFVNDTDKAEFLRCRFDLLLINTGRGGSADLRTCYIRNVGTANTQNGMLASNTDGALELTDGTVVDGAAAAAGNAHISSQADSTIRLFGEVVCSALGTSGMLIRDGAVYTRRTSIVTFAALRFVNACVGGVVVNSSGEGVGGDIDLPDLFGTVTAAFGIRARGGPLVQPGSLSSLVSSTGTNRWSADDGLNNVAADADGTSIMSPGWPYTRLGPDLQEISFTFATASPLRITPLRIGDRMVRAIVIIDTVFDGAGASLTLGTAALPAGILSAAAITVTVLGNYATLTVFQVAVAADLQLTITPGGGATTGAGRVLLEIWRA